MARLFNIIRLRGVHRERISQLDNATMTYAIDTGNKTSFLMKAALAGIELWESTLGVNDRAE